MKKWAKNQYKKLLFTLSANNHFLFLNYYRHIHRPKKGSLDEFLNLLSCTISPLTVIQVGANDGITHDPIHKYIKRDRWRGVLLEPQREVYQKYLSKIYALHPEIHTVNAALGKQIEQQSIYKIAFSQARWATGLTSFRRDVVEKAFSSGHVARQAKKEGIAVPVNKSQWISEEKIEVISVDHLLTHYDINKIDLLQIDTEGYDFEIIKLFDLQKLAPRVIIYENMHLSEANKHNAEDYLIAANYQVRQFKGNTLAMRDPHGPFLPFFNEH